MNENENNNVQQPAEQQPTEQNVQQPVYTQPQQPMYNQPQMQPMYNQQVYVPQKNSNAIAGMVLGIISTSSVFIGFFAFGALLYTLALICGIVGIVLSAKGRKNPINKGQATAGLVLSIVGTSIAGIGFACVTCACAALGCVGAAASSL